ncbi:MAG: recombinase family protein [Planctomycetes bacterium]|nr:recombinase family protein [Planctomycetota bacterium]
MKAAETETILTTPATTPATTSLPEIRPFSCSKIAPIHLEKLAIVYVRQSSPKQVLENRESTARQYAMVQYAELLGWSRDRTLVIDEDQGQSGKFAENRTGFQRLLGEVTMEHVGIVLGLEISRLSRSSKDWHQLFELCAMFGTLLGDQEGVYDANDPNDRLILGLKGLMSEMELQTMRNRLDRGRINKAQRGEMFHGVPMGYVILPTGEVDFDPDEQARSVIELVFEKFDEIGSVYSLFHWLVRHDIRMPVRARSGVAKGQLQWRRPSVSSLAQMLHHPIYAGAYTYGRRQIDPKGRFSPAGKNYRPWAAMEKWIVLIKDHLPAYITWEQFEKNQERIQQNRNGPDSRGAARDGCALLPGVLVCGTCGRYMQPSYHKNGVAQYSCNRHYLEATEARCYGLAATELDSLVSEQVLRALEPAALELSLKACEDVEQERQRLDRHWWQQLKRARYDVELAERRYQAVDPDNRLVAGTLEARWEEMLRNERQLQDEHDRFQRETPSGLSESERVRIKALSGDIPALWNADGTTNVDRKEIIRCLVDRVVVHVRCDSEFVDVVIQWAGGYASGYEIIRAVATYAQLRDFETLMARVVELRESGHTAPKIAKHLNAEGFYPPKRRGEFTAPVVYQLLKRRALIGLERSHDELLGSDDWWLTDLARELQMSHLKLRDWAKRGWVHSRKTPVQGYWILWADKDEVKRLRKLLAQSRRGMNAYSSELKTPKERPVQK